MPDEDITWWRDGVIYQVYVRSFADSNGDGIGDLRGVIEHLDHLGWLGVDGVWLSPVNPSPDLDWGYDVSDYRDVHPDLGDLRTLDELVGEAGSRGIRILLDLVPNHTSDRHPWFVDARSSRDAAHRDWYVWADPRADGSPPNNWRSVFGGKCVGARPHDGSVLPPQLPPRAARSQLVERGGPRRVRRHPAVLVRSGHRGLPHRCRERPDPRPGAARQPFGDG